MNIHNLITTIYYRSSTRDGSKCIINAEGTHYHRSSRKETEVGNDAEGTHLTLIEEGDKMTYRPYQWNKFVLARKRALIHKILNYRTPKSCTCKSSK